MLLLLMMQINYIIRQICAHVPNPSSLCIVGYLQQMKHNVLFAEFTEFYEQINKQYLYSDPVCPSVCLVWQ